MAVRRLSQAMRRSISSSFWKSKHSASSSSLAPRFSLRSTNSVGVLGASLFALSGACAYANDERDASNKQTDQKGKGLKITVLGARWCGYSRKFFNELNEDGWGDDIKFLWQEEDKDFKPPNDNLPSPQGFPTSYLCNLTETKCMVLPGYVPKDKFSMLIHQLREHLAAMERESGDK